MFPPNAHLFSWISEFHDFYDSKDADLSENFLWRLLARILQCCIECVDELVWIDPVEGCAGDGNCQLNTVFLGLFWADMGFKTGTMLK